MSRASSIQNRIDKALNKVNPTGRLIYKRLVTTIGDVLIGKTISTSVDTLLNPQPAVDQAGRERFSGAKDTVETVISPNGTRIVKSDYILTVSSTSVSEAELENPNLFFVFKTSNSEEALFVMDFSPIEFQGVSLTHQVYARSVSNK